MFPYLSPQMFQGLDTLKTDLGTKLTIGDGGLFSQPFQNVVNSDISNEYGSCESERSVINTPAGLFYLSQEQGKVFHYSGQGLENIANRGMKWWFNKYLPSQLLKQFPELEGGLISDNPVVGVGCQSIYDPNDDIVYFCKRDYVCDLPELPPGPEPEPDDDDEGGKRNVSGLRSPPVITCDCIEYNEDLGFVVNLTKCQDVAPEISCPPGYIYDGTECCQETLSCPSGYIFNGTECCPEVLCPPEYIFNGIECCPGASCPPGYTYDGTNPPGEECCRTETFPAVIDQDIPTTDIVIAMDWSGSTGAIDYDPVTGVMGNTNRSTAQLRWLDVFLQNPAIVDALASGSMQIGFTGWSNDSVAWYQPGNLSMTNLINRIDVINWYIATWCGWGCNTNGQRAIFGNGASPTYGDGALAFLNNKVDTDNSSYVAGTSSSLGDRSSSAFFKQILITVTDAVGVPNDAFPAQIIAGYDAATPAHQSPVIDHGLQPNPNTGSWAAANLGGAEKQELMAVFCGAGTNVPTETLILDSFSNSTYDTVNNIPGPNQFTMNAHVPSELDAVADQVAEHAAPPPPGYSCADPTCDLIDLGNDAYECRCTHCVPADTICIPPFPCVPTITLSTCVPVITENQYLPISLDDPAYFKEISWTVSYDPKSQAWISFHDWHPELCFPSINHFLTTKTLKHESIECPPGYTYNSLLGLCEQGGIIDLPAIINVDEVPAVITGDLGGCVGGVTYWDETTNMADITNIWARFCLWTKARMCSLDNSQGNSSACAANMVSTGLNTSNIVINGVPPGEVSNEPGTFFERNLGTYQTNWTGTFDPLVNGNPRDMGDWGLPGMPFMSGEDQITAFCGLYHDICNPTNPPLPIDLCYIHQFPAVDPVPNCWPCDDCIQNGLLYGPIQWAPPYNWFYYNTIIEKYIVMALVPGGNSLTPTNLSNNTTNRSGWRPCTYAATDYNVLGSPSAHEYLSSSGNWSNAGLASSRQTLSGKTGLDQNRTVVSAQGKASNPATGEIRCALNSSMWNGFYSICGFNDYEMEITLGSSHLDDDNISVVLAAFQDKQGLYGPVDVTHFLTLVFNGRVNTSYGNLKGAMHIMYNQGQEAYAFRDGTGLDSGSGMVLRNENTPFFNQQSGNNKNRYDYHGSVRVRVEKTGRIFRIWTTLTMGTNQDADKTLGEDNPFVRITDASVTPKLVDGSGTPAIEFDIGDIATWTNAPSYAVGDELLKFEFDSKIGFGTFSQPSCYFNDLFFDGYAVSSIQCECPENYTKVYRDQDGWFTESAGPCEDTEIRCRKIECVCPPAPITPSIESYSGVCDDIYESGNPGYINTNPRICRFDNLIQLKPDDTTGSIWKHNQRCDSFANYYGTDYPWEVELVESTGQAVNTVRNLEYQLESYVYKGNKLNQFECGDDRWHDLDWNFDEVIIYNTEQVSGLLKLNLNPKSDPITALQYPIINAADIDILYTKEEQKYRLNQFWDITKDRGEFTSVEQQIFITQLNGYIRDLNAANLDYNKAPTQRKKFRHYYNKAILRRRISGNRKMLLKLVNTKLNLSFR